LRTPLGCRRAAQRRHQCRASAARPIPPRSAGLRMILSGFATKSGNKSAHDHGIGADGARDRDGAGGIGAESGSGRSQGDWGGIGSGPISVRRSRPGAESAARACLRKIGGATAYPVITTTLIRPSPGSLRKNGPNGLSRTGRVRPVTAGRRVGAACGTKWGGTAGAASLAAARQRRAHVLSLHRQRQAQLSSLQRQRRERRTR
jgi:hypothetical protein